MESLSTRFKPTVPSPDPVLTVTVRELPLPVTPVIEAPVTPLVTSAKSPVSTPVTVSLKVTVNCTLPRFEGVAVARLIEETVGAVLSIV